MVPRPGHQCAVALDQIVCFGGYGEPTNPNDIWASRDGASGPSSSDAPWSAASPDDVEVRLRRARALLGFPGKGTPRIVTFGGDRERFELPPQENALRIDNDVWKFAPT